MFVGNKMVSLNSSLLFACLLVSPTLEQVSTTTIVSKKFAFEKVCMDYYGTAVAQFFKIRDKSICGTKCAQFPTCNAFTYDQPAGYCRLNTDFFVNRTTVGCSAFDLVDYGELTTLDPLRFAPDPGVYCIGACTNVFMGFRLCDGGGPGVCHPAQGRLEVFYNNAWGTVCDDYWEDGEIYGPPNANVACRMFGYSSGESKSYGFFGDGVGTILLDDIFCTGTELSLLDCPHDPWTYNNCGHSEDQGVVCY